MEQCHSLLARIRLEYKEAYEKIKRRLKKFFGLSGKMIAQRRMITWEQIAAGGVQVSSANFV